MTIKEQIVQTVENLDSHDLEQVAEFLAFVKFRARTHEAPQYNPDQVAAMYSEFAKEDHQLAGEGMADYRSGLLKEDAA